VPITSGETAMKKVLLFYLDGFRRMTVGKTLWMIILLKVVFIFAVLKLFFFPDFLKTHFADDEQRADHVFERLQHSSETK